MGLRDRIQNARDALRGGRLANEAAVCTGVVLPLLDALGWPVFGPQVVMACGVTELCFGEDLRVRLG